MFTSGTSSGNPKVCPRRVDGMVQSYDLGIWGPGFDSESRFLFSAANFRIIAPFIAASVWKVGGTVVMPAPAFAPNAVLDAIEQHIVTRLLLLPAQLHALVANPTFRDRKVKTVRTLSTGGDMITRDLLFKMSAAFPSASVYAAHGMTEGGGMFDWTFWDTSLADIPYYGEISPLGQVVKGARLRIWDNEKQRVARRGQPGELHLCNNITIRHYIGHVHEDSFYEDEVGCWFKTGDLGLINPSDVVYILGRIKDVIKRAGVSITPAALESSIGKFTGSSTITYGRSRQEAFAVLQDFNGKSENEVKQCVIDLFGKDYQLAGAASLKQLGLDTLPLNATGKVVKLELQRVVEDYLHPQRRQ